MENSYTGEVFTFGRNGNANETASSTGQPPIRVPISFVEPNSQHIYKFAESSLFTDYFFPQIKEYISTNYQLRYGADFSIVPPRDRIFYWREGEHQGFILLAINRTNFPITNIFARGQIVIDAENGYALENINIALTRETWGIIYPFSAVPLIIEVTRPQYDTLMNKKVDGIFQSSFIFEAYRLELENAHTGEIFIFGE